MAAPHGHAAGAEHAAAPQTSDSGATKSGDRRWPAETGTHEQRDYLRCISAVDEGVGRIFAALEKLGQLENTVIMFAGDNGYMHGEHGMGDKRQAYNESMRIPLIMRGPGIPAGGTVEEIVLNLDVAPTFLDLAGLETPHAMQGRSLLPLARGKTLTTGALRSSLPTGAT